MGFYDNIGAEDCGGYISGALGNGNGNGEQKQEGKRGMIWIRIRTSMEDNNEASGYATPQRLSQHLLWLLEIGNWKA